MRLREMKSFFVEWDPNTTMKCAIFEENGRIHNMQRVLGHVTVQNAVRRMGDFVLASCAANALQPYKQNDNGWDQGQVFFTPSMVWAMPPYYAQKMASCHHKPFRVFSTTNTSLDITATTDEERKEVVLHVANTEDCVIKADIRMESFGKASQVKVITLSGRLEDVNTPEQPERIVPQEKTLYATDKLVYEFPAYSYIILIYSLKTSIRCYPK